MAEHEGGIAKRLSAGASADSQRRDLGPCLCSGDGVTRGRFLDETDVGEPTFPGRRRSGPPTPYFYVVLRRLLCR